MPTRRTTLFTGLAAGVAGTGALSGAAARTAANRMPATDAQSITTPRTLVVATSAGRVRGYDAAGIATFKGIPYGADTSGTGRFMPPRPAAPWPGERLCMMPGPICPQPEEGGTGTPLAFLLRRSPGHSSEDCLNLNVWTPGADNGARPVMVWIHGGNFSTGSGLGLVATDGEALARKGDIVMVSVNHRLNAMGYLDLQGAGAGEEFAAAANVGMLDLVLALQWVRDNIGAFGGDPGNVTIFGQSGGGLKVTTLCAMPLAAGLFHKAIVQSGSQSEVFRREMTAPLACALLTEIGITPAEAKSLQDVPLAQLQSAAIKVAREWGAKANGNVWKMVAWAPVLDGAIIPADPYSPGARRYSAHIPLLVGTVRHEFCATMFSLDAEAMTFEQVRASMAPYFNDPDAVLAAFRRAYPEERPVGLLAMISSMGFNRHNAVMQAQNQARAGAAPAWLYRFDWLTPMLDGSPRAYHCSELPLVFNSIDKVPEATGTGQRARTMAEHASNAWLEFARHGNPALALPAWPAVQPDTMDTMLFDDTCRVDPGHDRELLELVIASRKTG
jgi:para-nitrobenzyl esterase